ncbi:Cupredoxin [Vararia minispora EC-137]|uniref:Cupredoxin n=1 Tax=Vararia minispora EC-137 TaxID=1314806 RepID=A0ACB8QJ87_9AGAM|nr:Cupredoxin [Vararia minispora EC-137]
MFALSILAVALTLAVIPPVRSVEFTITVGGPGGVIAYEPPCVNASVGDVVTFVFKQKNHTVTQSSFGSPCTSLNGGFDTGFIPVAANNTNGPFPIAQLTVQDTNPIWVYCRQTGHCQQGMVFAINPAGKFDAFKAAAMGQSTTTATASASNPATTTNSTTAATSSNSTTDHHILVGNAGTLTFSPANITAQPGDTVTFEFRAKNHTVTQSTFGAPCLPLAQSSQSGQVGFDSGFVPVSNGTNTFPTFTVQVNDTAPIWVYCKQQGHCGKGMVFAVNAIETGANNFDAFVKRAETLNGTSSTSGAGRTMARVSMHVALATAVGGVVLGMLL